MHTSAHWTLDTGHEISLFTSGSYCQESSQLTSAHKLVTILALSLHSFMVTIARLYHFSLLTSDSHFNWQFSRDFFSTRSRPMWVYPGASQVASCCLIIFMANLQEINIILGIITQSLLPALSQVKVIIYCRTDKKCETEI